jgi:hypothetical protein
MSTNIPISDSKLPKWLSPHLNVDDALDPSDPLYEELYEPLYKNDPDDPIRLIFKDIELKEVQSLNFISGFRGSGKTTETLPPSQATPGQRLFRGLRQRTRLPPPIRTC